MNSKPVRIAVACLAVLVVLVAGMGTASVAWLNSSIRAPAALDPTSPAIRNAAVQAGDENVLMVMTDFPKPGAPSDSRAGTVVVTHTPAGSDDVVVLSLPSDLEINRPPCERWDPAELSYQDQTVPAEARTTLLSAFEVGGPRCTTRVVQVLTGLAITRFVALDRTGVTAMAGAVGVDACPSGPPPDTDAARLERDYGVVAAVLGKTLTVGRLGWPTGLGSLFSALSSAVLAEDIDLNRMLAVASALRDLDADGVTFAPVPLADTPNSRGHSALREAGAAALFKALREDTALPPLDKPRPAVSGPQPANLAIDVFNGSGKDGLAAAVADQLRGLGFAIDEIDNAPKTAAGTVITFSPDQAATAQLLAIALPGATQVPDAGSTGVLKVVLGTSFDAVVPLPAQNALPVSGAARPDRCG